MVYIIPRSAWGARYPNGFRDAPLPAREVWLHHSVTVAPDLVPPFTDDDAAIRTLENIGQQRFGGGISYTWPITPVGRVYEGHSVHRQGAHTGGRNDIARAICFVGNYDVARPTPQMVEAAAQLLVQEFRAGRITAARLNGGHRQAPGASTACPGRYGMEAIPVINARAAAILGGAPTAGGLFMALSAAEEQEVLLAIRMMRDYLGANGGWKTKTPDTLGYKINEVFKALPALVAGAKSGAPVDVQALAAQLAPLLTAAEASELAKAVADEQDRRARERLGA